MMSIIKKNIWKSTLNRNRYSNEHQWEHVYRRCIYVRKDRTGREAGQTQSNTLPVGKQQNMHTFSMMNYNYMAQQMPTFIQFKCQREKKSSISFSRNNIVNIMQNILSFSIIKKRNINRQPRKRNTAKPWALWKQHVIYNKCQNISWTVFLILRFAYFWRFLFFEPSVNSIQKQALEWESVENSMSMSSVILHCKNLNI